MSIQISYSPPPHPPPFFPYRSALISYMASLESNSWKSVIELLTLGDLGATTPATTSEELYIRYHK